MKRITIAITALCATMWASAAVNATRLSPRAAILTRTSQELFEKNTLVDAYITLDNSESATTTPDDTEEALRALGVKVTMRVGNLITARVPMQAISQLASIDGVKYVQTGVTARQMLDVARDETGMNTIHAAGSGLNMPYTGKGVVVGVVDCGFDYTHAAFADNEGSLRIKRVWDQATEPTGSNISPEPFGYGTEFSDPAAILASGGDIRNNSHGTHVTSIAAGSDTYLDGALRGMAPDADIVLVSMREAGASNVNISNGIAYIFNYAKEVDKPCVINISLGAHSGPHDGTSTFDVLADAMQGPGCLIVGAAGNSRAGKFHINRTFQSADEQPLRTFIDYLTTLSTAQGSSVEVWASPESQIEVALIVYKTSTNEIAERMVVYPNAETGVQQVTLGRNVTGEFTVATEVSPLNNKHHIVATSAIKSLRTGYSVGIEVKPLAPSTVDIWAEQPTLGLTSKDIEGFTAPSGESTICEIGGTARRILTVGAYTTRSKYTPIGETQERSLNETDGDITSFSSNGPTADGRIKPQVSAPGCYISAAVSSYDQSGTATYSQYHTNNGHDNFYGFMQGTSMASPMVAGIVATWLQAWPEMTPEDLLDIVRATSKTDSFTGDVSNGSNDWGYGKINALDGLKECLSRSSAGVIDALAPSQSNLAPAFVSAATPQGIAITFTASLSDATVEIYSPSGSLLASKKAGTVTVGDNLNVQLSTSSPIVLVRIISAGTCHTLKARL